jgi:DNA-binding GntR family transcriptional regulator
MAGIRKEVTTRMPRPDKKRALHPRPGAPVLDVWPTSIDQGGEPYELNQSVMRGDLTGLVHDVPVE